MPLPIKRAAGLREKALAWLALREHTRQELRGKLLRWVAAQAHRADAAAGAPAPSADEIEPLLDALEKAGHLSDRRFVESRVHARESRFGNRRIVQELRLHGVRPDEATLARLKGNEAERARAVWAARFGRAPADAAERARQMRFLAGRGFSAETIRRLLADPAADE